MINATCTIKKKWTVFLGWRGKSQLCNFNKKMYDLTSHFKNSLIFLYSFICNSHKYEQSKFPRIFSINIPQDQKAKLCESLKQLPTAWQETFFFKKNAVQMLCNNKLHKTKTSHFSTFLSVQKSEIL